MNRSKETLFDRRGAEEKEKPTGTEPSKKEKGTRSRDILEPYPRRLKNSPLDAHPAEAFFKSLINNLTDGVVIFTNRKKLFVNKAFLNIYGLKRASTTSIQSLEKFIHPDERRQVKARLSVWLKEERRVDTFEHRIVRPDGLIRTLQASLMLMGFGSKKAKVVTIRDITDIRTAEETIGRLNTELGVTALKYKDVIQSLEAINETVCHDLRIPLVVIERFLQKLSEGYTPMLDQKFEELIDMMIRQINWMNKLIDGMLAYKQLAGNDINRAMVSVKHIVRFVVDAMSTGCQDDRKVIFKFGHLPPVYGDETMLRQVFMNLISNAFKFTKYNETAIIEVGALEKPHEIIYYVKDNGEGFDMQYEAMLFNAFQRFGNAGKFEGTGVGLAIVKRIIKQHGGRVWAESKAGYGASFYFALPRTL